MMQNSDEVSYLMAPKLDHEGRPSEWSECSRSRMTKFLELVVVGGGLWEIVVGSVKRFLKLKFSTTKYRFASK